MPTQSRHGQMVPHQERERGVRLQLDGAVCSVFSISESFVLPKGGGAAFTESSTAVAQGSGELVPYGADVSNGLVTGRIPPMRVPQGIMCSDPSSGHGFEASRVASRQQTYELSYRNWSRIVGAGCCLVA